MRQKLTRTTHRWVVELILDLVGYAADRDLGAQVLVEPSCGTGAFLVPVVERLVSSALHHDRDLRSLGPAIRAFDLLDANAQRARKEVAALLTRHELADDEAVAIAAEWVASADDVANFASRAHADLSRALELAPEYPDALAFAAIAAVQEGDVASARKFLARIDALQLPGNNSILPIVNNVIRPAVEGAGTTTTTAPADGAPTSAPRTSAPPG